jgi:hypothetical protein
LFQRLKDNWKLSGKSMRWRRGRGEGLEIDIQGREKERREERGESTRIAENIITMALV